MMLMQSLKKLNVLVIYWLDVDKYLYEDDELFAQIQAAIKNITKEEYDFIFKELED